MPILIEMEYIMPRHIILRLNRIFIIQCEIIIYYQNILLLLCDPVNLVNMHIVFLIEFLMCCLIMMWLLFQVWQSE